MTSSGHVNVAKPKDTRVTGPMLSLKHRELCEKFKSASTTSELSQLIQEIDQTTNSIQDELDDFVKIKLKKHQNSISNIELTRARLTNVIENSGDLTSLFGSANDLGMSLTYKIKSVDEEIRRVDNMLAFVKNTQLLKNNINQANYAIEHSDWEVAAKCINVINSNLTKEFINGKFASVVIPSADIPELPEVTIKKWIVQLVSIFKTKFKEAANNKDVKELTKYFQLFPLISQEEEGLNCYSDFICQIISDTSRNLIQSNAGNDQQSGIYASIAIQLFENISMMLSQHGPLIKKYYSTTYDNAIPYVVGKVQYEVDSQIGLISDSYYDNRRILKLLQDIKLYDFPILSRKPTDYEDQMNELSISSKDSELVPLVEVGDYCSELGSILCHWSLYSKFITLKYYFNETQDGLVIAEIISSANFNKKIQQKYLPAYESMNNFYFRRSLEKAISIEEVPSLDTYLITKSSDYPEHVPCSSVIEDIVLVLNNQTRNIIEIGISTSFKKFVTEAIKVLQVDLINGFLIKNLNDNQPRYNNTLAYITTNPVLSGASSPGVSRSGTPVAESNSGMGFFKGASSALGNVVSSGHGIVTNVVTSNSSKLTNFVIYLNTVAVGQEYTNKVFDSITKNNNEYLKNAYPFGKDYEKVYGILKHELIEPFTNMTNKLMSDSLVVLYNQSFKNRIVTIINDFLPDSADSNYVLFSSSDLSDNSGIIQFKNVWHSLIGPYRATFHRDLVFSKFLRLIVINLANLLEKRLLAILKKFNINEMGAIKLEKDMSFLINEVCEDNYELKEKFVRITQIILLIGMDNDEYEMSSKGKPDTAGGDDEDDYSSINWILTPQERIQFRKVRI